MMLFDKDNAIQALATVVQQIMEDPKAIDAAVYQSGILRDEEGAMGLSSSDICKAWRPDGSLDEVSANRKVRVVSQNDKRLDELAIDDFWNVAPATLRQKVIFKAVLLSALKEIALQMANAKAYWDGLIRELTLEKTSKDEDYATYVTYCKKQAVRCDFTLSEVGYGWLERLPRPLFSDEKSDTLAKPCFEALLKKEKAVRDASIEEMPVATKGKVSSLSFLMDMLDAKIDCVFLLGEALSPIFHEDKLLLPPFETLSYEIKPIAQVGKIVSYEIRCEGHRFDLHYYPLPQKRLSLEESAYLYALNQKRIERQKTALCNSADLAVFEKNPSDNTVYETQSPWRLCLYQAAIECALNNLLDCKKRIEEESLTDDISTLGLLLERLKKHDLNHIGALQETEHVPKALKAGEEDERRSLLGYLIEHIESLPTKACTYLLLMLVDPSFISKEQQDTLLGLLKAQLGDDEFYSMIPRLLTFALSHVSRISELDEKSPLLERQWTFIYTLQSLCVNHITALIKRDDLKHAESTLSRLRQSQNEYDGLLVSLPKQPQIETQLKQYEKAFDIYQRLEKTDFFELLKLEETLIGQIDSSEGDSLSEAEALLLLDYNDCFETLSCEDLSPPKKQKALEQGMCRARARFLSHAFIKETLGAINQLNLRFCQQAFGSIDAVSSDIREFSEDETRLEVLESTYDFPKIQVVMPDALLIHVDEFLPEYASLLKELIERAKQKGVTVFSLVSTRPAIETRSKLSISDDINTVCHVDVDISRGCARAIGAIEGKHLELKCEPHQHPLSALQSMFYCLGEYNDAISFFNGERQDLSLEMLPGYLEHGFSYTPLVTLYRPAWLKERLEACLHPKHQNTIEEQAFFEKDVAPFLDDGVIKTCFDRRAHFTQNIIRFILYKRYRTLIQDVSGEDRKVIIHTLLSDLLEKMASRNAKQQSGSDYENKINQSALHHYKMLEASMERMHVPSLRHQMEVLLKDTKVDLLLPISDTLMHLTAHFTDRLRRGGFASSEWLSDFQEKLKEAERLCNAYADAINAEAVRETLAAIHFMQVLSRETSHTRFFGHLKDVSWEQPSHAWLTQLGLALNDYYDSMQTVNEQQERYLLDLIDKKAVQSGEGFFKEAKKMINAFRERATEEQDAIEKHFYCIQFFTLFKEGALCRLDVARKDQLVENAYFGCIEDYDAWALEQEKALIVMFKKALHWRPQDSDASVFYENVFTILKSEKMTVASREDLCAEIITVLTSLEPCLQHQVMSQQMLVAMQKVGVSDVFSAQLFEAFKVQIQNLAVGIQPPHLLNKWSWQGLDGLAPTLKTFYELCETCQTMKPDMDISPDKVRLRDRLHAYYHKQLSRLELQITPPMTVEEKARLFSSLEQLDVLSAFFEAKEEGCFNPLPMLRLKRTLKDVLPLEHVKRHSQGKTKIVLRALTDKHLLKAHLLREPNNKVVLALPDIEDDLLGEMHVLILREANRVLNLDESLQYDALGKFFAYLKTDVIDDEALSQCGSDDLSFLYGLKRVLLMLLNFAKEQDASTYLKLDGEGRILQSEEIADMLLIITQTHAKCFVTALKTYIEENAINNEWEVGRQWRPACISIPQKGQFKVPKRIQEQYDVIMRAFPEEESIVDYVEVEEALFKLGCEQSHQHSFWSSKPTKAYFELYELENASTTDLEQHITARLGFGASQARA